MKLTELEEGEIGTVSQINLGPGARRNLSSRGITRGSKLKMIRSSNGPVVVKTGGTQMAVGRGMARKINILKR